MSRYRSFFETLMRDGRPLLMLVAAALVGCGTFAIVQASTGELLPHDTVYLGMTARDLCARQDCRILHFMIHDRISFGGAIVAIGVLYAWLVMFPMRRRQAWAWWTLASSGVVGFLSFLAYLGYGYLDTWHGMTTLALLPIFIAGLLRARSLRVGRVKRETVQLGSRRRIGRMLLQLTAFGITLAGFVIMIVGMTRIFVPQDLEFLGAGPGSIAAINPHLLPLIAHDRAGFGGALASFGVAMFGCVRHAPLSRALWQALVLAGVVGFGTAIGVHPAIGYLSATHLGPAVLGAGVFAAGLVLARESGRGVDSPGGIRT